MSSSRIPSPRARPATPQRGSTSLRQTPSSTSSSLAYVPGHRSAASSPPTSFRQLPSAAATPVASPSKRSSIGSVVAQSRPLSRTPSSSSSSSRTRPSSRVQQSSSLPASRALSPEHPPPPALPPLPPPDFVQAAYDFIQPDDPTYLCFRKGQLIRVVSKDVSGWWNGDLEGRQGWFPSNYVITLDESPASIEMLRESSSSSAATASSSGTSLGWERRASEAPSTASSTSDSYSEYGLQRPRASQDSINFLPRSTSRQSHGGGRKDSSDRSPPSTSRKTSQVKTPPRVRGSRSASGGSTRNTNAILDSITTAVQLLHSAVAAHRISHFQPSTACVISSVRSVLSATDCLPKDSPLLKLYPALARERKQILAELSKLVFQARVASGALPDESTRPEEMEKMLSMARRLLAGVKTFLSIAVDSGVDLPDHSSSAAPSGQFDDEQEIFGPTGSTQSRTAALATGPQDLDRTPTAAPVQRERVVSQGTASGRRLVEALQDRSDVTPLRASTEAIRTPDLSTPRTSNQPSTSTLSDAPVQDVDAAEGELVHIISALISSVYSSDETPVLCHILESTQESLTRVLRILKEADSLQQQVQDAGGLAELDGTRTALLQACSSLLTAAEQFGRSRIDSSASQPDDDFKFRLLAGAANTLRTATACKQVFHQLAALLPASSTSNPPVDDDTFDDSQDAVDLLARGLALMTLREHLEKSRAVAASHELFPRAIAVNRQSVDSISLSSSRHFSLGEDVTIRATPPPWSEEDALDDVSPVVSRPVSQSCAGSVRTEASLSLSTQTVSTDVTNPSPRSSTEDASFSPQPLVRSPSSGSADIPSVIEFLKKSQLDVRPALPLPSDSAPRRARATTLSDIRDPPVQVPEAIPDVPNLLESNNGRLFIVGHDFTPADIAMGPDGSLTGASLPALVEKLTPHDTSIVDPALLSMFFLTFRLFTTPVELYNVVVHRYRMEGPAGSAIQTPEYAAWMENKVQPVRIRIFSFLKLWLDSFWRPDVDAEVLPLLEEFATGTLQRTLPSVAPRLLHALRLKAFPSSPEQRTPSQIGSLLHKAKSTDRLRSGIPTRDGGVPDQILPPTPQIARSLFSALRSQTSAVAITDFDPLELARQLTVMESKLFLAIKSQDVLESYKRTTPALKTMSTFHGHLTSLVQDTILTERDIKKRSAILKFFIKLANRLLHLFNFSSAFAVVASLNGSSITRLKKTWDALSSKAKLFIAALRDLFDPSRNHANYRARLRESSPPALPFLGLILSDITFCNDGNQNTRRSPLAPDRSLINLSKYNGLFKIVSDMQRFQVPYPLAEVPEVQIFLSKVFTEKESTSVENLYRKSLSVEPRTATTSTTHT